ncbi:unnamed protein product [Darwinula stevensoni]|uniref:DET1- and DDB1-associated protein 1 n=1 Tax=Darwinula stevensoni TaxID=69355 RepID=A0A7R8X256_9CRUS|nr:unnamed protein product [Darwinula stevensoni]CAG0880786.1 unnamed protein product [Darwinula stevensoni]
MAADFLKELPSFNQENFSRFQRESNSKSNCSVGVKKKEAQYLPTRDIPSDHVIVTEKTNILLRYLHQHWEKKNAESKKRDGSSEDEDYSDASSRKKIRLDLRPYHAIL